MNAVQPGAPATGRRAEPAATGPTATGALPDGPADRVAEGEMDSDWERPRPDPSELRRDVVLAGLVMAAAVFATVLVNSMGAFVTDDAPGLAEQVAWSVALTGPLVWRRRTPEIVALLLSALLIASQIRESGEGLISSIALFLAIYSLGAWGRHRGRARWLRIGVIVAMFTWLGISMAINLSGAPAEFPEAAGPLEPMVASALYSVGYNLLFFLSAYYFGNQAWESARRRDALERQTERLHRSQQANAEQAVVAERVRIARDLHDVVAHHVSVMGVQAAAARRVFSVDPDQASRSLGAVEQTARSAITELRGLLGVLRAGPADGTDPARAASNAAHPASPGLDQIATLVEETRTVGIQVELAILGTDRAVPDTVALSAYRVIQEGLTNTVKHAGASAVDVRVRHLEHALEVEVTDDGRGLRRGVAPGSGLGLIGMRERVAVHAGELEVGPVRGGGFRVRARFPIATDAGAQRDGEQRDREQRDGEQDALGVGPDDGRGGPWPAPTEENTL